MREVLKQLVELQEFDTMLDHIESLKGDLPLQVKRLETELQEQKNRALGYEERYHGCQKERGIAEMEIKALEGKQTKYQAQLFEVKTNREYDAMTHELELLQQAKSDKETRIIELMDQESEMKEGLARMKEEISELEEDLATKTRTLKERMAETEKDEIRYRDKRQQIAGRLKPQILNQYERIRNAKGGNAVVTVDRGACGGCQIALPPQKVLEVRKMDRIHLCEVCGRILVWNEKTMDSV